MLLLDNRNVRAQGFNLSHIKSNMFSKEQKWILVIIDNTKLNK